ncbi:hypothetical protein R3W88_001420 [Solanum pinnatisectum]|uniref:PWWP domain-containing protein n=1 Tax=Solanum pinnatisectum TaxID=50273 RepID=A0AAV9MIB5_9SOLN|nr:hypothetical protein R3W88_001420 [Solanum pinnatisectum]
MESDKSKGTGPGSMDMYSLVKFRLTSFKEEKSNNIFVTGDLVWGKVMSHPWWPGKIYDDSLIPSPLCDAKRDRWFSSLEEAIDELKKRAVLGLTCSCLGNFQPTRIEGLYKVDVSGYTSGTIYSSKQIKKCRDGFHPHGMFSFVKKLAMSPRSLPNNVHGTINIAKVNAYRKAVFEENDDTYDQAVDEFEKGVDTYVQAFGVKASSSEDPVEFSKYGNQCTDGDKSFENQGDCSKKSCKRETKRKRREESPPDDQGHKGKFQTAAFFDHRVTKSGYCPDEHEKTNKKQTLLNCQDEEEWRGFKSLHMTKKYGDQTLLTPQGDDVDIQSTLSVESEKKFTEEPEWKAEPTMLVINFSPQTMLPTASELKAKFAYFGPFDESALRISWGSATCQIVFLNKCNAQAAYDYAVQSRTLFNSDVKYHLTHFDGSEKLMGECFDDIQSFKSEPPHMSFQELPLLFDTEMKPLPKENSKCRSDVEEKAFLKGNTDTKSIVCDYPEVDVKVNIDSENCPVVFSEILCASSPFSSSIQYKHKVGCLDETVVAINSKYSMDKGWKSHYQQNLSAISCSDLSLQLADLFQKCNEILGGIDESQNQFSNQSELK